MSSTKNMAEEQEFPAVIDLNVGGRHFTTHLSTLTKEPDSMLTAMFSGRHPVAKDKDGRFFIDADGDMFYHVLNFLRFEGLPSSNLLLPLYEQARYFGLQSLVSRLEVYIPIKQEKVFEKLRSLFPFYRDILAKTDEELNRDPFKIFSIAIGVQTQLDVNVIKCSKNARLCENCQQKNKIQDGIDFFEVAGFRHLMMQEFAKRNLKLELRNRQRCYRNAGGPVFSEKCGGTIMSFVVSTLCDTTREINVA